MKLPTLARSPEPLPFKVKPVHFNILEVLARFSYATAPDINGMLYADGSLTLTKTHVSELFHSHWTDGVWQKERNQIGGGAPRIYFLDNKGRRKARELGFQTSHLPKSKEAVEHSWDYLAHTLEANRTIVAAHRLARKFGYQVLEYKSESELRSLLKGVSPLVPDAWIDLRTPAEYVFAMEVDRGRESPVTIGRKALSYVEFEQQSYQQLFHTNHLTVVFVVTEGGAGRAEKMRLAIEAVLKERGLTQEWPELFRIGVADPALLPEEFFLAPIFFKPFGDYPVPLMVRR